MNIEAAARSCGSAPAPRISRSGWDQSWLPASHAFANAAMRPMIWSPVSNGAWPSSGTSTTSRPAWCARMASTVAADSRSELPPRITMTGTRAKRVELLPQRRQRLCEVGCLERGRQLHVVIGNDASAFLLERPAREGDPVVVAQFGKLAAEQPPQDVGRVAEARRLRQLADIALDPHQAVEVDHRADVVEHAAGDRSRRATASSIVRMPPREVPTNTARAMSSAVSTAIRSASSTAGCNLPALRS